MPLRSRPSADAAARVLALLGGAEQRGWVPQQEPVVGESGPDERELLPAGPERRGLLSAGPDERGLLSAGPGERGPDEHGPDERGPDGPTAPALTVPAVLRKGVLDPGRRGALALAVVGLLAAVVAGALLLRGRPSEQPLAVPPVVAGASPTAGPELVVDVAGRVRHPGLVRLPSGARVDDALRAAGGALPGTSTGALNLARRLVDGEQVLVGVEAVAAAPGAVAAPAAPGGPLDLNAATAQDLDDLPGIGPVLADRIVAWRTEHGRFASVDQLREVSGIGESKFQSLKAKVRV